MITIGHILEKKNGKLFTIKRDDTAQDALEIMAKEKISSLLVMDDEGQLFGIISERDHIRKVVPVRKVPGEINVSELVAENGISVKKKMILCKSV